MFARCTSAIRIVVGLRDRFFDQAFAQSNAKIAAHDLHQVLGLERRRFREQQANERRLRCRTACFRDMVKFPLNLFQCQRALSRGSGLQNVERRRTQVSVSPICVGISSSDKRDISRITCHSIVPPTCSVISSYAGNVRPERKMEAMAASPADCEGSIRRRCEPFRSSSSLRQRVRKSLPFGACKLVRTKRRSSVQVRVYARAMRRSRQRVRKQIAPKSRPYCPTTVEACRTATPGS